ncbi:lysozyme-like [Antedon mediterranea]|uniref:lysozyme-like n=1 Tax=Antedon mediterranea TaxID=105859 RepID=UPI003AF5ED48
MIPQLKPVYLMCCVIIMQSTSACNVTPDPDPDPIFTTVSIPTTVTEDCMKCICQVESNCAIPNPVCKNDVGSLSCGPYQIKENYYEDAQREGENLGPDWKSCTKTFECSERCVQGYMARYAIERRIGHDPKCEDFARIHNGGPNGYKKDSTKGYWQKVKKCLGN